MLCMHTSQSHDTNIKQIDMVSVLHIYSNWN